MRVGLVLDEQGDALAQFITVGADAATRAAIGDLPTGRGILGELIKDAQPLRIYVPEAIRRIEQQSRVNSRRFQGWMAEQPKRSLPGCARCRGALGNRRRKRASLACCCSLAT